MAPVRPPGVDGGMEDEIQALQTHLDILTQAKARPGAGGAKGMEGGTQRYICTSIQVEKGLTLAGRGLAWSSRGGGGNFPPKIVHNQCRISVHSHRRVFFGGGFSHIA